MSPEQAAKEVRQILANDGPDEAPAKVLWTLAKAYIAEKHIYRITDSQGRLVGVRIGERTWSCNKEVCVSRDTLSIQQRKLMNAVFDYITKECPEDDGPEANIIREEWG